MRTPRSRANWRVLGPVLCTLAAVGCGPLEPGESALGPEVLEESQAPVVYGTDNRMDVYAHPDATLRARAEQATVALMRPSAINATNPNNVTFTASTLGSAYNLCTTERFRDDPTPAFCSGTLIDDNLVLTAGHCITSASDCTNTRFVFRFYRPAAGVLQTVTTEDVYACQSIVARAQGTINGQNLDYAVVRLDRAATPRFTPAPVRPGNTALSAGQNVTVIGSGSGIPFKIDSGGKVRDARSGTLDYFVATTDTFGGNSGSGVYEMGNYTVAGILVRGETDYVMNGSCRVVNVCSETSCRGEDITYVYPAITAYCQVAGSVRLCGSSEPPPPPPDPTNGYNFNASNTSSATVNTVNKVVALAAGQKITLGTCGLTGAALTGDSYLRLFGPGGAEVASNDDACGGRGSNLSFTVPAGGAGNYEIRAGCYSTGSCGGTVMWELTTGTPPPAGGSYPYSASSTASATKSTVNRSVTVAAGQTIVLGTCGVTGSSATGDTYLRLFNPSGAEVKSNDDACGGSGSNLSYTAPTAGTYQIRAGCYSNNSCSGTVAWTFQ